MSKTYERIGLIFTKQKNRAVLHRFAFATLRKRRIAANVMLTSHRVHNCINSESKFTNFHKHMKFYTSHVIRDCKY